MKLFKTKNGLQDHTKVVVFEPNGDKTTLKQYTARGYFVDVLDIEVKSKFAVDKTSFLKAIGILKNPTFEETKTTLILKADDKEISLAKVKEETALNIRTTSIDDVEFKPLPEGFFKAIKEVSKYTEPNSKNIILTGVKINKQGISGGSNSRASLIEMPMEIEEIVLPISSLASIEKLTHFALVNSAIWFSNEDKTQVTNQTLIDGNAPKFERLFKMKKEGSKLIEFEFSELKEAITNAIAFDPTYITLQDNLLTSDKGYSQKITLDLKGLKGSFVANNFLLGLLDGELRISKEQENFVIMFEKDNQQTITTAYRVAE